MKMSLEVTNIEFNNLITRYLSGELSAGELEGFEKLLRENSGRRDQVEEYRKIWDSVGSVVPQETYDLDVEWDLFRDKVKPTSRSILFYTYRIAAMLLVGLLLTFAVRNATRVFGTELVVAKDEPVEVILEDGTHVVVNRNSRVRYQKQFDRSGRKVSLSGEAWFDVARDTSRPFQIDAGLAFVEVLGTSFNVNAYKENDAVEITVQTGMVAMTPKQNIHEQIVLKAGNSGTYNEKKKELKLIPTSDPNSISWKTRDLYFNHSTMQEVVGVINRVYDAHLVILDQELAKCPITVTFSNQSLDAILNVLQLTLDLDVARVGNEIRLDGEGCVE